MGRKRLSAYSLVELILALFLFLILLGIVSSGMWTQSKTFCSNLERNHLKSQCLNAVDVVTADLQSCLLPVNYYSGAGGRGGSLAVAVTGEVGIQLNNLKNQVITYQLENGGLQRVITDLSNSANNGVYILAENVEVFSLSPVGGGDPLKSKLWELAISARKDRSRFPESGQPLEIKIAIRVGECAPGISMRISTKPTSTSSSSTSSTTTVETTTTSIVAPVYLGYGSGSPVVNKLSDYTRIIAGVCNQWSGGPNMSVDFWDAPGSARYKKIENFRRSFPYNYWTYPAGWYGQAVAALSGRTLNDQLNFVAYWKNNFPGAITSYTYGQPYPRDWSNRIGGAMAAYNGRGELAEFHTTADSSDANYALVVSSAVRFLESVTPPGFTWENFKACLDQEWLAAHPIGH